MFRNKLPWFVVTFFILSVIIFILSLLITSGRTSFFGLATTAGSDSNISQENSYIFASPLQAQAGNQQIRVTVFILNSGGLGVSGQTVSLINDSGLSINAIQPVTDNYGKVIFDISSQNSGDYKIMAKAGSSTLPQSVIVTFN